LVAAPIYLTPVQTSHRLREGPGAFPHPKHKTHEANHNFVGFLVFNFAFKREIRPAYGWFV